MSMLDPGRRHRRQRAERRRRLLFRVVFLAALAGSGFWLGQELQRGQVAGLERVTNAQAERIRRLEEDNTRLDADARTARAELDMVQRELAETVPTEEVAALLALLKQRLAEPDMTSDRLSYVLGAVEAKPTDCTRAETRRFALQTETRRSSANTSAGFAEGRVTVTGSGTPATNPEGAAEAWFDPERPVTLQFRSIGGHAGGPRDALLPLDHHFVEEGREYRFLVTASERGFVEVTGESCALP